MQRKNVHKRKVENNNVFKGKVNGISVFPQAMALYDMCHLRRLIIVVCHRKWISQDPCIH